VVKSLLYTLYAAFDLMLDTLHCHFLLSRQMVGLVFYPLLHLVNRISTQRASVRSSVWTGLMIAQRRQPTGYQNGDNNSGDNRKFPWEKPTTLAMLCLRHG
jgi:hypothetical protein